GTHVSSPLSPHCLVLTCPPLSPHSAGFAHVLGESSSLQVLHEVRKAKSRGFTLLCKRKKNTCTLEHSVDVVA
ncbi:hypothetical protein FHG87_024629, partial [Trinorchestia longiramus]